MRKGSEGEKRELSKWVGEDVELHVEPHGGTDGPVKPGGGARGCGSRGAPVRQYQVDCTASAVLHLPFALALIIY